MKACTGLALVALALTFAAAAGGTSEKFRFSPSSIHHLSRVLYECSQDESLRVYDDPGLEQEVLSLQVRETPEGWRFDHRAHGYSDRVVALAMALQAAVKTRVSSQPIRTSGQQQAARLRENAQRERLLAHGRGYGWLGGLQPPRDGHGGWDTHFPR